jgi:hypothetical protein
MLDTLGMRIEKVQLDNGLNNVNFAKSVNCNYTAMSMYKMDSRIPTLHTIMNICKVYNVDANWLLFGDTKNDN